MFCLTPFLFVVLLAAVENAVIPTDDTNNRILGGRDASIAEFPSMVYLVTERPGNVFAECGGTIISERWILTAAHCVNRALGVNISVGSEYHELYLPSVHRASRIIKHNGFFFTEDNGTLLEMQNDIALVEVGEPLPLNNLTIKAAMLPLQDEDTPTGSIVTVVGWGNMEGNQATNILQKVNLEIVDRDQCKRDVKPITIDGRNLCYHDSQGEKRTCRGDSGGPVFSNGILVGINSISNTECTRSPEPGISTRVAYFRRWIKHITGI